MRSKATGAKSNDTPTGKASGTSVHGYHSSGQSLCGVECTGTTPRGSTAAGADGGSAEADTTKDCCSSPRPSTSPDLTERDVCHELKRGSLSTREAFRSTVTMDTRKEVGSMAEIFALASACLLPRSPFPPPQVSSPELHHRTRTPRP